MTKYADMCIYIGYSQQGIWYIISQRVATPHDPTVWGSILIVSVTTCWANLSNLIVQDLAVIT